MASKGFSIADAVRADVGAASIAAMEAQTPVLHAERTIENITSEILQLKADAGNAIIGIGQRLIEAKALLPHGEWLPWLNDQVEFSERTAQEFMRISREWSNPRTLADLGKSKALKLLLLPPAEREEFMSAHDVPNMSTRELEDAIRERDEAWAKAKEAIEDATKMADMVRDLQADGIKKQDVINRVVGENGRLKEKLQKIQGAPKAVYQDEAAIQKAADDTRREMQRELDVARDQAAKMSAEMRRIKSEAGSDKSICDFLCAEIENSANRLYGVLLKNVNSDTELSAYIRQLFDTLGGKMAAFAKFGARNDDPVS